MGGLGALGGEASCTQSVGRVGEGPPCCGVSALPLVMGLSSRSCADRLRVTIGTSTTKLEASEDAGGFSWALLVNMWAEIRLEDREAALEASGGAPEGVG